MWNSNNAPLVTSLYSLYGLTNTTVQDSGFDAFAVSHAVVLTQIGAFIISSGEQGAMVAPLLGITRGPGLSNGGATFYSTQDLVAQPNKWETWPGSGGVPTVFEYTNQYRLIGPNGITFTANDLNGDENGVTFTLSTDQNVNVTMWANPCTGTTYETYLVMVPDTISSWTATVRNKYANPLAIVTYSANNYGTVNGVTNAGDTTSEAPVNVTVDISSLLTGATTAYGITLENSTTSYTSINFNLTFTDTVKLP